MAGQLGAAAGAAVTELEPLVAKTKLSKTMYDEGVSLRARYWELSSMGFV